MERQLALIEVDRPAWRLDEETKRVGRRGVEQAREALRRARADALEQRHETAA